MINFNFEESQLLNNFFAGSSAQELTKESIIKRLVNAISNTDDKDLISIAEETILKIRHMNCKEAQELIESLPMGDVL